MAEKLALGLAVIASLLSFASSRAALAAGASPSAIKLVDMALARLPESVEPSAELALLERGLFLARSNHDLAAQSRYLSQEARLYSNTDQLEQVQQKLEQDIQQASQSGEREPLAEALYLSGRVHLALGNYNKAYDQFTKVESLYTGINDYPSLRIDNLIAMAEVSLKADMPELASKTLEKLEQITPKDTQRQWAAIFHLRAVAAREQNKLQEARTYLQKSITLTEQLRIPELQAANLLLAQRLALAEHNTATLYHLASEALLLAQQHRLPQLRRRTLEILAEAELLQHPEHPDTEAFDEETVGAELKLLDYLIRSSKENGDLEKAVEALERKLAITEKLHALKSAREKQALQASFSLKEKEAENRLLRKENQLQQLENAQVANRLQRQLLALALIITLLSIVIYAYFRKYRQHKNVEIIAYTDELTGAINRRAIMHFANQKLKECQINHTLMSIVIFDLDHFKKINDQFGHHVGDNVLKAFVAACQKCLRHSDRIGRIGGEEWMLVLLDAKQEDTERVIQRIRKAFSRRKVPGIPDDYPLTFSAGIAPLDSPADTVESLCKRADQALYEAKRKGRNRHEYAPRQEPDFLCFDSL